MRKVRVLVVDDDRDLCENLRKILSLDNRETEVAFGGEEALSWLRVRAVDVVILDLKMPGTDGMRVLEEMRRLPGRFAVIILTAYPTVESAIDAVRDKAVFDYIRKPFSMQHIRDVVEKAAASLGLVSWTTDNLNQRVGELIRTERNMKGMTSRDLARATGFSPSLISQVESGKSAVSLKTLFRIARALKVEMGELVRDL